MTELLVVIVGLGVPGFLPALAAAGRAPVTVFLAPLIGAVMAGVAAEFELGAGGSLITWYAVVAVIVNVAVAALWLAGKRFRERADPPAGRSIITLAVLLCALIIPLYALKARMIGWDANSIWLTHALMVSGGHHALVTGLKNPVYSFSNPDYPPLVPAAGGLAFALFGFGDLHVAPATTVLLNACALGVVGTGIAAVGSSGRQVTRIAAVVAGGAVCLAGFAVSGGYGVDGYTDLLWAAAAAAAVIWGLVLPPGTQSLVIAWICVAVASLTKNEGLATGLALLVLITLRYRPLTLSWVRRLRVHPEGGGFPAVTASAATREWARCAAFVLVPALPGLAWAGLIRLFGIGDNFFKSPSNESLVTRAHATVDGMAAHLAVAPVAAAVLVVGCYLLRQDRERGRFGNPAWLWLACLASLVIIFATYLFGGYEIYGWLGASVNRTTIFAQLLLYAELAIWLVIALDAAIIHERVEQRRATPAAPRLEPEEALPTPPGQGAASLMARLAANRSWRYPGRPQARGLRQPGRVTGSGSGG
jgi:hypothetical protein